MKIEKVNDHQIRCTLTKKELEKRDLKLSEIAYGNEKVKALFRDMMRMAATQYGFEAEDIPLMIEVIPFAECAVIVVTKVEDPDELDTRFSKFAPSVLKDDNNTLTSALEEVFGSLNKSDNILDVLKKIQDSPLPENDYDQEEEDTADITIHNAEQSEGSTLSFRESNKKYPNELFFTFTSLNELIRISQILAPHFQSESKLYKNETRNTFLLYISKGTHSEESHQTFCHLIDEYADRTPGNDYLKLFVEEHCTCILNDSAINQLASIAK